MKKKFIEIYNGLPYEGQQLLVEQHLAGLLDASSREKVKKVVVAAKRLKAKYDKAPKLDLRSKRKQIGDMLDELTRDAKIAMVKERSNRDELLHEIVESLVGWLNNIWSSFYEYNAHFYTAHTCLLFTADALLQLSESTSMGGCKCSVMNIPVDFTLKDKKGKTLRKFSVQGPQNVERILLWIWRDLFVCLFAQGSLKDKSHVPDYLEDMQVVLGVNALEKVLYGGVPREDDDDDDENWEDEDYDPAEYPEGDIESGQEDDADYSTDNSDSGSSRDLQPHYWSEELNRQRIPLREHVERHLLRVFKEMPSLPIFDTLLHIPSPSMRLTMEQKLLTILDEIAGNSADTVAVALEIYTSTNNYSKIVELLDKYGFLLRPRDTTKLQCAVTLLNETTHAFRATAILEQELEDTLAAIYQAIRASFSFLEDEPNKIELKEILKLKSSSPSRKSRVEAWAESVISNPGNPLHPMAFAAMMMGLPMIPGVDDGEDSDLLNYVDLDHHDPDFEDLREEYRPYLKSRFDGWTNLGAALHGGPAALVKLYHKAIEMMPFLQGQDIVNEMVSRLRERPNKTHVLDALNTVSTFAKMQRKKLSLARGERKRTGRPPAAASGDGSDQPSGSHSHTHAHPPAQHNHIAAAFGPFVFGITTGPNGQLQFQGMPPQPPQPPPPAPAPAPATTAQTTFPPVPGGMEDVD